MFLNKNYAYIVKNSLKEKQTSGQVTGVSIKTDLLFRPMYW